MDGGRHYKCFFKSSVLNDGDFDRQKDTIVKIVSIQEVEINTREGKRIQLCAFLEGYNKPFRLIPTICAQIKKALKTPIIEEWQGKHISVYIHEGLKAFGDIHDVPRVRPVAPRVQSSTFASADQVQQIRQGFKKLNYNERDYCMKAQIPRLENLNSDKAIKVINWLKSKGGIK